MMLLLQVPSTGNLGGGTVTIS